MTTMKMNRDQKLEFSPDELLGDVYGGAGNWLLANDVEGAPTSRTFDSPTWKMAVMEWEPEAAPVSSDLSTFELFTPRAPAA